MPERGLSWFGNVVPGSMSRRWQFGLATAVLIVFAGTPALASEWDELDDEVSGPYSWLGGFGENLRLSTDLSFRPGFDYSEGESDGHGSSAGFFGVDLLKVFSGSSGDWGTLTVQPYVTKLNNYAQHSPDFSDGHVMRLLYRNVNFNYTGLTKSSLNVRVGHFELPFGLEYPINTNGTLRDYHNGANLGLKSDWGASLNGLLTGVEYELAATRGTGQSLSSEHSPYVLSGRVGTFRSDVLRFGFSALYGETDSPSQTIERRRVGVDAIYTHRSFTILGEFSAGRTASVDDQYGLLEVDWNNSSETLLIFNQTFVNRVNSDDMPTRVSNGLGARVSVTSHFAFSAQWLQDLAGESGARSGQMKFQARVRF